jgi:hypothetical protein
MANFQLFEYNENIDELVKSHQPDGKVKSFRCKARESLAVYIGQDREF